MSTALALQDTMTIADAFVKSGFFADAKSQAQAVVKILAGQELGFGPMASMTGIHIIKGKVTLSANIMAAALKQTGRYNYRVTTMSQELCVIDFYEGAEKVGTSSFSLADAQTAGLTNNPTWKKFPRNMLFARAMSNGVRWYAPDLYGAPLYTPDELGADVDGETGEIITVQATIIEDEPAPEAQPRMNDVTRKRFHATGKTLYGDDWDDRRHTLVWNITSGATKSSNDLTPDHAKILIDGMMKRINENAAAAEPGTEADMEAAQAENADSAVNQ